MDHCDIPTLKSLRTVNKTISAAASRHLYEQVSAAVLGSSLEKLAGIANHPIYSQYIKVLNFSGFRPVEVEFDFWARCARRDKLSEQGIRDAYRRYEEIRADSRRWTLGAFVAAVAELRNLTGVLLDTVNTYQSPVWVNIQNEVLRDPEVDYMRETETIENSHSLYEAVTISILLMALRVRARSHFVLPVTTLTLAVKSLDAFDRDQSIGRMLADDFKDAGIKEALYHIQFLEIVAGWNCKTDLHRFRRTNLSNLASFLGSMKKLQSLSLFLPHNFKYPEGVLGGVPGTVEDYDVLSRLTKCEWPRLEELFINVPIVPKSLIQFTQTHGSNLLELHLEDSNIFPEIGLWKDLMPQLVQNLPNLKFFRFGEGLNDEEAWLPRLLVHEGWSTALEDFFLRGGDCPPFSRREWNALHVEDKIWHVDDEGCDEDCGSECERAPEWSEGADVDYEEREGFYEDEGMVDDEEFWDAVEVMEESSEE